MEENKTKWSVQIIINGGWAYIADMTDEEIDELLKLAEIMERNTANDPI